MAAPGVDCDWFCVGRNRVKREKRDCCAGGGFFSIDLPGTGIVTADDDGGHDVPDEDEDAMEGVEVELVRGRK